MFKLRDLFQSRQRVNISTPVIALIMASLSSTFAASLAPKSGRIVSYTVTTLGTLGGNETSAMALNEAGEVVGNSKCALSVTLGKKAAKTYGHAFLWKQGKMQDLDKDTSIPVSGATAINNQGEIVGTNGKACLWKGGHCQSLGSLPGGVPGGEFSMADSINNNEQVCGLSLTPHGRHAFLWQNGKMTDLTPDNHVNSEAKFINDRGQMLGYYQKGPHREQAAYWSQGKTTMLGYLPGGKFSDASCINSAGQIVGSADDGAGNIRAFLWTSKHGMVRLNAPASGDSRAGGINRIGQIVGSYNLAPHVSHACLWQHGVLKDLNDLIPAHSGWVLEGAAAINNHGQIAVNGRINGQKRAFLLTPKSRRNQRQ
jgi:probable HAF family extracellular repeat protein